MPASDETFDEGNHSGTNSVARGSCVAEGIPEPPRLHDICGGFRRQLAHRIEDRAAASSLLRASVDLVVDVVTLRTYSTCAFRKGGVATGTAHQIRSPAAHCRYGRNRKPSAAHIHPHAGGIGGTNSSLRSRQRICRRRRTMGEFALQNLVVERKQRGVSAGPKCNTRSRHITRFPHEPCKRFRRGDQR